MTDIKKNIADIYERLNVEDGLVLNLSNIKNLDICSTTQIEESDWERIENPEHIQEHLKAVIVNEDALDAKRLEILSRYSGIKVFVICKNPISKSDIYRLLSGHIEKRIDINGYTGNAVKKEMLRNGYRWIGENNILKNENDVVAEENNIFAMKGSLINSYLDWLEHYVKADLDVDYFIQAYEYIGKDEERQNEEMPFLSVITRTQGKRIEALRETFLSLAGQSCDDFEVLVMGHNIEEENEKKVLEAISETPEFLRRKIKYIPVYGGNRSTPINKGFEKANGEYAVLLDDDDIVFDQWVSVFKEKAKEYPGSIVHAYVVSQKWSLEINDDGREILRAEDAPENQFCKDFHYIKELYGNSCPVLGLAFPLFPFKEMGFAFDETLDTTEDWDYLMSLSGLCGVVDIREVTSMYRLWNNAENSHSLHTISEWNENRKKIQNRMMNRPLLLPKEYVGELIDVLEKNKNMLNKSVASTPLYYDIGNGYNEVDVKRAVSRTNSSEVLYEYRGLEECGEILTMRWDPCEFGNIYVEDPTFVIDLQDGKRIVMGIDLIKSNGFRMGNKIIFFHPDPQMYVALSGAKRVSRVTIMGKMNDEITEDMHNYLAFRFGSRLTDKMKIKVKTIIKKILGRL